MAPPFEEVDTSDADSIDIASTQASDAEAEEYGVEKILSEERSQETGEMMYLIKWERYPLHLSTWEPAEHLLDDQILSDWQQAKDAVKAGVAQPFDMDIFWEATEKYQDEKEDRKLRRAAKRRKLGLPSRGGSVANRSSDEAGGVAESSGDDEIPRGRQKRIEDPTPKHKGVAQKAKTSLNKQVTMIISSDESGADSEGEVPLMEKSRKKSAVKAPTGQSLSGGSNALNAIPKPATSEARGKHTTAVSVTPATKVAQKRPSVQLTAAAKKAAATRPLPSVTASANLAKRTQPSSSARKSAPSTASEFGSNATLPRKLPVLPYDPPKRKAPADPFDGFGKSAPERKGRRLSASNPKSQRFSNLAEENRVRKHSAKEGAPDPSVLATFNPVTGRWDEPAMKHRAAGISSASAANNVFGRREAPAPVRQRSVSLPATASVNHTAQATSEDNTTPYLKVCWDWRDSKCYRDNCTFAHHFITCPAWRQGHCPKREIDCHFDHQEGRDPIFRSTLEALKMGVQFPTHNANSTPLGAAQSSQQMVRPTVPSLPSAGKQSIIFLKQNEIPCFFWARGHCFKSADKCKFVHHNTGAPLDPKQITCGFWYAQGQCMHPTSCKFAHEEMAYSGLGSRDESTITCSLWLAGRCKNDRCEFAHHETDCRSLGPPKLASADDREMSPGEVVDDEPIAEHTGASHTGAAQTTAAQTTAAQTTAAQASAAKKLAAEKVASQIIAAAQTTAARTTAAETTVTHITAAQRSPVKTGVAPTANMIPASRRPSLPVPRNTDQPAFINDVALEVRHGDLSEFKTATRLVCSTKQDAAALNDAIGMNPQLVLDFTMNDEVIRKQVAKVLERGLKLVTGDIICKEPRRDHARKLADGLHQSSKCGLVNASTYTLLVYPTGTGEWAFLTREGDAKSSQAPLKFILLPVAISEAPTSKDPAPKDTTDIETDNPSEDWLTSADVERLLRVNDLKTEERVFIMMPPSKADEMLRMAKVFKDRFKQPDYSRRETRVCTSLDEGKWDSLAETGRHGGGGGLLIVDWEVALWEVPHLAEILHHSSWRVFSVGVDTSLADKENRAPAFGCQRLFPMGDVVYVTDDVFKKAPEKVLRIIDEVNRRNDSKPPGASRHKIAARPGVKMWLMEHVAQHAQDAEDPVWLKLLHAVWDLCPDDKQHMFYPGNPSKDADMVSEPATLMPTHQTLFDKDPAAAVDWMVNWFAGWAWMNADTFRRFTVCHEEPNTGHIELDCNYNKVRVGIVSDPRGWAKEYSYVLFRTPDEWLKEKSKVKK